MKYKYPSVLTIAGSDSGGGAGIQADLKTFSALGCYGTSAITAITVQNTLGVKATHGIPPEIVYGQIKAVMEDIRPAAIKLGMVHSAEVAIAIAEILADYRDTPVIFDPVMAATSGEKLSSDDTIALFKTRLFPLMTLITPNLDEAEVLTLERINNPEQMSKAAKTLLKTGCNAVLIKGGHLKGDKVFDIYHDLAGNGRSFESEFLETRNLHGTGCTLSSAIAAYITLGYSLTTAIEKARKYVFNAIKYGAAVKTGAGNGPLNHFFNPSIAIRQKLS